MIDPVSIWTAEWANLPPVTDELAPVQIANFVFQRVSAKLSAGPPFSGGFVFTFAMPIFQQIITDIPKTPTTAIYATRYGDAFQSSCVGSALVCSGGFIGAATPPTTFSAPPAAVFDPGSVAVAKAALVATLMAAPPAPSEASIVPIALHQAFSSLKIILSGLNSIVPTPTPLVATVPVL